ncbi:MAG TPA: hypothetical protein VFQ44_19000 [Streptosporangiaceae bacterium]|nr:hypothetical protein [Streptosporangiaceae bacterium]
MAVAFAGAMAVWIWLVMRADKHPHGYQDQTPPMRRDVLGGAFVARDGGRQVAPDPREPPEPGSPQPPEPEQAVPAQRQAAQERATQQAGIGSEEH